MKFRTLIVLALCASVPALACAKKPKKTEPVPQVIETPAVEEDEDPVITEECLQYVSLVHESVKNKQFADAYEPWMQVYTDCPNANKSIYTNGAKILDWKLENAQTDEEKQQVRALILEMYDKRIKYFGDDAKYPKAYILGEKGLDYCKFYDHDELKEPAYGWLKQSIEGMGKDSKVTVIGTFFDLSYGLYKSDSEKYGQQFIADYSLASGLLQTIMNEEPTNSGAIQFKERVDNIFALSGAADCAKLDELYANLVKTNSNSMEDMQKLVKLYKRVNCTESDVYFAAAEAVHKMQPSSESAAGCAKMCMKKEDWHGAIEYYKEAISMLTAEDVEDKADYLYAMSYIYMDKLKNYPEARSYARQSLDVKAGQGRCYILVGCCYAASHPYSEAQYGAKAAILNKTVFWVAVDQFKKAKSVDETCTDDANKLIAAYSKYFPTKEEMFDLPNEFKEGGVFTVGGWINEQTICRSNK